MLENKVREEICVERECKHQINIPIYYSDHRIKCSLYENIGQDIQTPFFLIKRFSPLIMLKENKLCYFCLNFLEISLPFLSLAEQVFQDLRELGFPVTAAVILMHNVMKGHYNENIKRQACCICMAFE